MAVVRRGRILGTMTDRREFVASLLAAGVALPAPLRRPARSAALPSATQLAWQDLEVGMFIHFAPNTWQDREYDNHTTSLEAMNPDIDTDQWAAVARDLGARYIVFVAKHQGGFCMWQTETSRYGILATPWKRGRGDVLADLAASCRRANLGLGVYLSPRDDTLGAAAGGRCGTLEQQRQYDTVYRQQLTEVLTRYGEMTEVWFDGSIVVPVGDILAAHARRAAIFQGPQATIRWVGNENGFAPSPAWNAVRRTAAATGVSTAKDGDPDGGVWLPIEVDVSLRRPNWFWNSHQGRSVLSLPSLLEIYYRSVGHGTQLLLNIPPDTSGHIAAVDAARAKEFGDEVRRRFGRSAGETRGQGDEVVLRLAAPADVDHVVMEEDLRGGERIREYRLEGYANGRWGLLGAGTSIGHKRIQPVPQGRLSAVRLLATRASASPRIRRLAAFATGSAPPPTWNERDTN